VRYYNYESFVPDGLTNVACYVCGQSGGAAIGVDRGYRIEACGGCGFAFVNPRPSAAELGRLYASYYDATEVVPEKWEREMRDVFEECGDWLGEGGRVGTVLDVGCSFGHLLRALERRGWQTTGIEPSSVAAAYAETLIRGSVHRSGFEDVALEPASFDAVVSLYVLEHVNDPRAFMAKVHDILKPGGQAIIRIPYTRPLFPVNRLLGRSLMHAPMHLNDFSPAAMQRLGRSLGFSRVAVRVGRHRKAHDPMEHAGAAVLGGFGRALERVTRGRMIFPLVGALSYRLFKD
jgi:SAM-dependent methyltransferase